MNMSEEVGCPRVIAGLMLEILLAECRILILIHQSKELDYIYGVADSVDGPDLLGMKRLNPMRDNF